jgi:hypothetical protein
MNASDRTRKCARRDRLRDRLVFWLGSMPYLVAGLTVANTSPRGNTGPSLAAKLTKIVAET